MSKKEILDMLNHALDMEHAANVQYLSHAEIVDGEYAEPIIARLKEIAGDEKGHQEILRTLIGDLGGVPSMGMTETHSAGTIREIWRRTLRARKRRLIHIGRSCRSLRPKKYSTMTTCLSIRSAIYSWKSRSISLN